MIRDNSMPKLSKHPSDPVGGFTSREVWSETMNGVFQTPTDARVIQAFHRLKEELREEGMSLPEVKLAIARQTEMTARHRRKLISRRKDYYRGLAAGDADVMRFHRQWEANREQLDIFRGLFEGMNGREPTRAELGRFGARLPAASLEVRDWD